MTTLLAFAFVLGVLVFVHELGHFLAAKRVGIRVLKFQLGFNPTIASFRRGDTEYSIGALPLGGYVKMAGEQPEEIERNADGEVVKRADEFLSKSKWERFQVLIMGPVMNLITAVLLLALVLYQGADSPDVRGSAAGRRRGRRRIAGGEERHQARATASSRSPSTSVDTWDQFFDGDRHASRTATSGSDSLRDGQEHLAHASIRSPTERFEIGDIGVLPNVHPHLGLDHAGEPGRSRGTQVGRRRAGHRRAADDLLVPAARGDREAPRTDR